MTSPRTALTQAMAGLDGWTIHTTPRELDAVARPTLIVWSSEIRRLDVQGLTYLHWDLDTWVTVPAGADPATGEDNLEAALLDYLAALDATPALTWATATRGVLADKLDGYRVVVTLIHRFERS